MTKPPTITIGNDVISIEDDLWCLNGKAFDAATGHGFDMCCLWSCNHGDAAGYLGYAIRVVIFGEYVSFQIDECARDRFRDECRDMAIYVRRTYEWKPKRP